MFVGHYAAAFVLKGKEKGASLGMLFIATQFVDILFFPLAVMGVENLKFVKNYTAVNEFKMDYYPFTHGLLGTIVWSAIFYILYSVVIAKNKKNKKRIAIVMALGVLSHWFMDIIVHTPDLPLIKGEPKIGLGLWNSKMATYSAEALVLVLGLVYYLKKTEAKDKTGKYIAILLVVNLLVINYINIYVLPANDNIKTLTVSAIISYIIFAVMAQIVSRRRV